MYTLQVGAPYIAGRTRYTPGAEYNFRGGIHEIRLFWNRLKAREIRAVRYGLIEFGLLVDGPILFFLYRIEGATTWSETPYTIWAVDASERQLPEPSEIPEPHALVTLILVDADSGLVRALRQVTWSPAFTAAMHLAIESQYAAGWCGQRAFDAHLRDARRRFPTVEMMARAAQSRTVGGQ